MNENEKKINSLKKKIAKGGMLKQMLDTPGYKEVFGPWLEQTLSNYEKNGLINVNKMTEAEMRVFGGEYRGVKLTKNFFTKAIQVAEKASEDLKLLEKKDVK